MSILTSKPPAVRAVSEGEAARNSAWQRDLRAAVRDAHELCRRLGLPAALADAAAGGADEFPVFVPPAYLARIRPGDPHDPLLRQVMPVADETTAAPGFSRDPVADKRATLQPGVLQKYAGRALLVETKVKLQAAGVAATDIDRHAFRVDESDLLAENFALCTRPRERREHYRGEGDARQQDPRRSCPMYRCRRRRLDARRLAIASRV